MTDPVTVFLLVVAGLLVVGTVGEQVFARTGVPAVIWLVVLGVLVRVAGIVPAHVITGIAPFFAALALVIVLFDAGTNLTGGTGEAALPDDTRRRAQRLAFIGFAAITVVVALFSQGLHALEILPTWSWVHAFMLGSLVGCGASEVSLPSLRGLADGEQASALLRRESAITKALAVAGLVVCLDLLSPRVAEGGAFLAMLAGFGFALAFGSVAGMLWVVALQQLAGDDDPEGDARNYGFTLAVMVVLYVLSEAAGGAGALSVLVFGAVLGNSGRVSRLLRRGVGEDASASAAVSAALGGHARTIQFVRTLIFAMVGLTLAPPWGPIVMGVALALLVLVTRLAVARFALAGLEHRARSIIGASAPRGMATVALATLPLAHAVPGAQAMLTLVFAAVTTSVLLFTIGVFELRREARPAPRIPVARPQPASPVELGVTRPRMVGTDTPRPADLTVQETRAATLPRSPADAVGPTPIPVSDDDARAPTLPFGPDNLAALQGPGSPLRARTPVRMPAEPASPLRARTPVRVPASALPQIDRSNDDDPLANAMARALAKRPDEVTTSRRRPTGNYDVAPPTFTPFPGSSEEDAMSVLARIGQREDEDDGLDPAKKVD